MTFYIWKSCATYVLEGIIRNNRDIPIWIVGDMNLPNVNWNLNTVDSGTYPMLLNKLFLDLLQDHGFT